MPNWASSSYAIVGEKEEIKALYDLMNELQSRKEPLVKNGFGCNWLGCLVTALGGDWEKVHCRGSWESLELKDDCQLNFNTETAWSPCNEVMDLIIEKYPSLGYYYICEEPGMALYITNDEFRNYFPERYKVDLCTPEEDYETEYFYSMESLSKWFRKHYDVEINSIEDINALHEKWEQENEDAYCYIYEFEIEND